MLLQRSKLAAGTAERPRLASPWSIALLGTMLLTVLAANAIKKQPGRREYLRGRIVAVDGRWQVKTTGNQGSGVLRSMSEANCFVVLPENCAGIQVGDSVQVQLFEGIF